eukprot:1652103-Alexandrium_andersonii.AAC.1
MRWRPLWASVRVCGRVALAAPRLADGALFGTRTLRMEPGSRRWSPTLELQVAVARATLWVPRLRYPLWAQ